MGMEDCFPEHCETASMKLVASYCVILCSWSKHAGRKPAHLIQRGQALQQRPNLVWGKCQDATSNLLEQLQVAAFHWLHVSNARIVHQQLQPVITNSC